MKVPVESKILMSLIGGAICYGTVMCGKKAMEVRWFNKRKVWPATKN